MDNKRLRLSLATLAVLLVAAMLLQPFLADNVGQLVALAVWAVLWLVGATAWAYRWYCAHERDRKILSEWRAKAKLSLQAAALFAVAVAGVAAIGLLG